MKKRNGAGTKSRTRDLLITSQLLYQLSYTGTSLSFSEQNQIDTLSDNSLLSFRWRV